MKKSELYFIIFLVLIVFSYAQEIDEQKPTVTILAPVEGQMLSGEFVVRASATDNVGVQRVEFLIDGIPMFTDTIPTAEGVYQWLWNTNNIANGMHQLTVAPFDEAGNFNDLTRVSVTVNNVGTAQPVSQQPVQTFQPVQTTPVSPPPPTFPTQEEVAPPVSIQQPIQQPVSQPVQVVQQVQPVVPVQQRPVQTQPSAPARGAPAVVEETVEEVTAEKPLWLSLVMSLGLVIVAGGLLAFAFVKMRSSGAPDEIVMYVSNSMQRGYPIGSIQRALQQQGWDDKVIEEAFKKAIGK